MASSARIEELERKFNENPRRYFAPLANEYRKAGDLEQAIAICRTYVPQQPAHMSGHIVFGQALFEAGEHEEARGVFEAALALDPENLIALRHLGDIARERGETSAARNWYQRVLDADPRNDEVSALIVALNGPPAKPATQSANVPTWAEINPERTLELPPELIESAKRDVVMGESAAARDPAAPSAETAPPDSAGDQTLQPPPPTLPRPEWLRDTPVLLEEISRSPLAQTGPIDSAVTLPPPSVAFAAPAPAGPPPTATPVGAPPAEMPPVVDRPPFDYGASVPGFPEAPPSAAREPAPDLTPGLEPMEFVAPPRPEPPVRAAEPTLAPAAETPGTGAIEETPTVFVTETMAELYLQQGFRDEALSVYRQLLAQSPGDALLRERVEQLEGGPAPSSTGSTVARGFEEPSAPPIEAAHVPVTVRAFFAALASRAWSQGTSASSHVPETATVNTPAAGVGAQLASPTPGVPFGGSTTAEVVPAKVEPPATPGTAPLDHSEASAPAGAPPAEAPGPAAAVAATAETEAASASAGVEPALEASDTSMSDTIGPIEVSVTHTIELESRTYESGFSDAMAVEAFDTTPSLSSVEATQYDVASYDAADMAGTSSPPPAAPAESAPAASVSAESSPPPAAAASVVAAESSEPAAATTVDQGPAGEVSDINGAAPAAAPRKPMQTGSVNVLFPQQTVRPADESAAATLSDAFGGPSHPAVASTGHPARPATNELSLDSIFRESAPPAEPRREASAFSFDQFFTDAAGAAPGPASSAPSATPAREAPSSSTPDTLSSDAEQFSTWLAGLKKK